MEDKRLDDIFDQLNTFPNEFIRSTLLIKMLSKKEEEKMELFSKSSVSEKEKSQFGKEAIELGHEKLRVSKRMLKVYRRFQQNLEEEIWYWTRRVEEQTPINPDHRLGLTNKKKKGIKKTITLPFPAKLEIPTDVFCFCQKNIEGTTMINCENPNCKYKWFHLECLGITEVPCDKWYCDDCLENTRGNL